MRLRFGSFLGVAVLFLLAFAAGSVEGNAASHVIEVTAADLADDPDTAENGKTAREKVQAKIDGADAGDVVQFPDGTFEDVGELLFSVDGGEGEGEEIVVRGNVADPSAVVFTGKIMFNVKASNLVIEGFTFKDTKVPDRVTHKRQDQDADDSNDDQYVTTGRKVNVFIKDIVGVVWINTAYLEGAMCPGNYWDKGAVENVKVRNNAFLNSEAIGVMAEGKWDNGVAPPDARKDCGSSDVVISGNTFTDIGFNRGSLSAFLDGGWIDRERNVRTPNNRVSAIKARYPTRMTITDNVIDGTTYAGIMLNETFGKTVVQHNEVKNVPAFGIRIKGNKVADQSDYEVVVSDNSISNTNNDPYAVKRYSSYRGEAAEFKEATRLTTDRQADEILKPEIWRVSAGANFGFGNTGAPRPVSDFADTEYNPMTGARVDADASLIPQEQAPTYVLGADKPCGDGTKLVNFFGETPGTGHPSWCYSVVKFIDPALDAAIVLGQLNAKTIRIENNEITGNTVGLLICEKSSCAFRDPFNPLGSVSASAASRIPAVIRGNNIYGNEISGSGLSAYLPASDAWGEVINALEGDDNELDLSGNYLGERPRVLGNVKRLGDSTLADSPFDLSAAGRRATANDRTAPSVTGTPAMAVDGATLTITYNEALGGDPLPAAFTVKSMTSRDAGRFLRIGVSGVDVSGMTLTLTLARAVTAGEVVTVSYDSSKAGENALSDVAVEGNLAAGFSDLVVEVTGGPGTDGTDGVDQPGSGTESTGGGGGGCALASAGSGGVDLGTLLPFMLAALAFGRMRRKPGESR